MDSWWANVESNHRPPAYQAGALTAELLARSPACAECGEGMTLSIDLKRFSLPWATEVALNCLPADRLRGRQAFSPKRVQFVL